MFTPKKQWTALSVADESWMEGNMSSSRKEKAVTFVDDPPPPPTDLLSDDGIIGQRENMEDWKKFLEAGLLDEAPLLERDKQAAMDSIQRLEKELLDYQHTMGLLLIEKNEWTSKLEELHESLQEASEILKREKAANLIVIAQAEEREDNLRKALDAQKSSSVQLESSLRKLYLEHENIRKESEATFAEAEGLVTGIQDKLVEVQKRLLEADAKLARATNKSIEVERKLQEVETRENVMKRERLSIISEKDAHEVTYLKHKEDMRGWERKLQEREERLCQSRRSISERDEKMTEFEERLKQKENELMEEQDELGKESLSLKKQESEVIAKLHDLTEKQEKAESIRNILEMKEKDLTRLFESRNVREKMDLQSLLDERRSALDVKEQEFEVVMKEKRTLLMEEFHFKLDSMYRKLAELCHLEKKLMKQDEAVEKKLERAKGKDKGFQSMLNGLEDKEKVLNEEAKNLDYLRCQAVSEKENVKALKDELEKMKSEVCQKQMQVHIDTEKLRVSDEERKEHMRLVCNLKQEIERYRHQRYLLSNESDKMKVDRKKFEQEWEALDEKRVEFTRDLQQLEEEKILFEGLKLATEKELSENRVSSEENIKRELEFLRLSKESFEFTMKHEQPMLNEKSRHEFILNEFEGRRKQLEADIQKKEEELERSLHEKEKALEEKIELENISIRNLKEALQKEIGSTRSERNIVELDKQNTALIKQQVEEQQAEMHKDVNELVVLCKKLKMQRQEFIRERQKFVSFTESLRNCQSCDTISMDCIISELNEHDLDEKLVPGVELLDKVASYEERVRRTSGENKPKSPGSGPRIFRFLQKLGMLNSFPDNDSQDLPSPNLQRDSSRDIVDASVSADNSASMDSLERDLRVHNASEDLRHSHFKTGLPLQITVTNPVKVPAGNGEVLVNGNSGDLKQDLVQNKEPPVDVNLGTMGDSSHVGKASRVSKRQSFAQYLVVSGGDDMPEDTGGPSERILDSNNRKKRQKLAPSVDVTGSPHYNLRRRKIEGAGIAVPVESWRKINFEVGDAGASSNHAVNSVPKKGVLAHSVHSSKEMASMDHTYDIAVAGNSTENLELDEEVYGSIPTYHDKKRKEIALFGIEEHVENEDDENPGEASIPRRVWNFFTS